MTRWHKPQGRTELTIERIRSIILYDPETGAFSWTGNKPGTLKGQRIMHSRSAELYGSVRIDRKQYLLHRLAWVYMYGEWPAGWIDHINHNKLDNSISNLRIATPGQNSANSRIAESNRSGVKGVSLVGGKFKAAITAGGKVYDLGTFAMLDDAAAAYEKAANELFGEFANPDRGKAERNYKYHKAKKRRRDPLKEKTLYLSSMRRID